MARVELSTQSWGYFVNGNGSPRSGAAPSAFTTLVGGAVTIYNAATGATPYGGAFVTNVDGLLPGWVDQGSYKLTEDGVERRVEAASGDSLVSVASGQLDAWVTKEAPINVEHPEYGAVGDDATNDTAAIQAAIDAVPSAGGDVFLANHYLVTGLVVKNKPVYLFGRGGVAQANSVDPEVRCPSKIRSATNAPILDFKEDNYTSIESQNSQIVGLGIEGAPATGGSQHGVWVNNRGVMMRDVEIGGCGGAGLYITDSVGGLYERVLSHHNNVEGYYLFGGPGGAAGGAASGTDTNAAVTTNLFLGCHAYGNGGNGWNFYRQANGNIVIGSNVEGNGAGGDASIAFFVQGANTPKWNMMHGVWLEVTQATSLYADAGAYGNQIWLTRDEGLHSGFGTTDRNLVHDENGPGFPLITTASLPVASAAMNGKVLIEDGGAGNRNLIVYAGGERFRIDGGANV